MVFARLKWVGVLMGAKTPLISEQAAWQRKKIMVIFTIYRVSLWYENYILEEKKQFQIFFFVVQLILILMFL